jgi:type I restriction enzyme S subunit
LFDSEEAKMPKLDKLIRELCSDGVKVFRLEEIAHYAKTRIDCKTINEDNYVGVENLLQNKAGKTKATSVPTTGMVIAYQKNDILIGNIRPYLRKVWLADCEGGTNGDVLTVQIEDTEKVIPQFLYYVLSSEKFFLYDIQNSKGAKMPRGSKDAVMKFEVPLPHLDVQREIVRMLDSYTESVVELQRQLTAELTARKTQYAYYRDKLLQYKMPTKEYEVGEICEVSAGGDVPKEHFSKEKSEQYKVPVISNGCGINAFYGYTDAARVDKPAVTVAARGTIGYAEYRDYPYFPIIRLITLIPRDDKQLNAKYLYYSLEGRHYKVPTSGIPQLTVPVIKKEKVSIPPLDVQNRIVNVLDNFEKICSDLNIGLPAEIEARQKQYEYYRDKLLTFAETGNTILSRAEQSRAEQSRAEQSRALIKLLQYVFGYAVVTLEDIAENCDSMRKPVTSGKREAGEYPYYGASGIVDYVKDYIFDGDYLLVSEDGANLLARSTPIAFSISGKNWVNNHAHVLKFDCYETRRFVEFYLNSIDLAPYISGGAQPKLNQKNLNRIEIPLPSQERQKYIVDILDRFDAICNDLTSGLPAEIEARQKQYEYYRDKLLNFGK